MPAEDDETVTGLLALLGARLAPSDDVSANVVLAAQAAKARMQGSDSDGKAFTDVMEIKSDSRRFTFRANAYGNYARFGRTYTPEQLRQHREFLAKEEQEQQQEKARQEAEREAREAARREERKEQEARQEAREAARRKKQKARQEGRADNPTGFVGVYLDQRGRAKPYLAKVSRGGKTVALGSFATAAEAALHVARSPEGQAAARRAAAAESQGTLPAVPSCARLKQEDTVPPMPPGTFVKEERRRQGGEGLRWPRAKRQRAKL